MTNMILKNQIDKNLNQCSRVVMSIGTIDIMKMESDLAITDLKVLIDKFKITNPDTKLAICTIPPQYDPYLSPKLQQKINQDIDDVNSKLHNLTNDIDTVDCNFTKSMLMADAGPMPTQLSNFASTLVLNLVRPTVEQIIDAINSLRDDIACSPDEIPATVLKKTLALGPRPQPLMHFFTY
ncbi:unnamed protein product [Didymodactylos carnosus]|uniref:Uncharacterized protein n=1 Tax=Didymodactylos carnosus TaxID=1234261 RepID=A0A813QZ03_9BILA|nr:unnamed protein product [Didymodactylos carnosus]CAF3556530.1 unnamed protein product [Didymodactylos carnosus]